ncbi:hypothetical protein [Komagataeibacter sp. FNDCF1]|uniref:hypothetical protein n=1 Tax=Komagataeibacter sp. FNDCF1 TaxID=2878681 RepID=UPI001E4103D4|nr:hypothetical protein [Komagataeibacter sp. FNDCF1]MCE2563503.1 hypothetical protein [Komagataeibacter sp. FNDCF1]
MPGIVQAVEDRTQLPASFWYLHGCNKNPPDRLFSCNTLYLSVEFPVMNVKQHVGQDGNPTLLPEILVLAEIGIKKIRFLPFHGCIIHDVAPVADMTCPLLRQDVRGTHTKRQYRPVIRGACSPFPASGSQKCCLPGQKTDIQHDTAYEVSKYCCMDHMRFIIPCLQ